MRLLAISDLHVGHDGQLDALATLPDHGEDWLIVAGDVGDRPDHLHRAFDILQDRFARLIWVPGNHELWTFEDGPAGVALYESLVSLCRDRGVLTPECPWPTWPGEGPPRTICPLFLLYDYTFTAPGIPPERAVEWAMESGILCADERRLDPSPHASRGDWCRERLALSEARLRGVPDDHRTVLVNHWPLRQDLVRLHRIPRFSPWCGAKATEGWHRAFRADVVVSGHLHMRATDWRDGTRFEEVALGYPRHWNRAKGVEAYLREILPGPADRKSGDHGPIWHR